MTNSLGVSRTANDANAVFIAGMLLPAALASRKKFRIQQWTSDLILRVSGNNGQSTNAILLLDIPVLYGQPDLPALPLQDAQ
jgi:hypothetical protein